MSAHNALTLSYTLHTHMHLAQCLSSAFTRSFTLSFSFFSVLDLRSHSFLLARTLALTISLTLSHTHTHARIISKKVLMKTPPGCVFEH